MPDQDEDPEIPTNAEWRGIMVRARKDHGLSQAELGAKVGVSQAMISKIETGESGGSSVIIAICKVLGIQPPEHFANEWQKRWSQLGHVLRNRNPEQAEAALRFFEAMAKEAEATPPPAPEPTERRK